MLTSHTINAGAWTWTSCSASCTPPGSKIRRFEGSKEYKIQGAVQPVLLLESWSSTSTSTSTWLANHSIFNMHTTSTLDDESRHSTIQYNTIQYNTIQYNTIIDGTRTRTTTPSIQLFEFDIFSFYDLQSTIAQAASNIWFRMVVSRPY
jgi:hypothetical protein